MCLICGSVSPIQIFLIFLDVSYPKTLERRKLNWTLDEFGEQQRRLQHARKHANLLLDTDPLTSEQVLQYILAFLEQDNG